MLSPASPPQCSTVCTHPRLIFSRHTSAPADVAASHPDFCSTRLPHFVHMACVLTQEHACVDVCPLGGVQPPQHTFFATLSCSHRCCTLSRQTFLHIPVSHSVHTARVHSQEHACVDACPLGGVQPPLHTCFAALCRLAGNRNATRCTIDARTKFTLYCWRQRPSWPTRPTHPPTYASPSSPPV